VATNPTGSSPEKLFRLMEPPRVFSQVDNGVTELRCQSPELHPEREGWEREEGMEFEWNFRDKDARETGGTREAGGGETHYGGLQEWPTQAGDNLRAVLETKRKTDSLQFSDLTWDNFEAWLDSSRRGTDLLLSRGSEETKGIRQHHEGGQGGPRKRRKLEKKHKDSGKEEGHSCSAPNTWHAHLAATPLQEAENRSDRRWLLGGFREW